MRFHSTWFIIFALFAYSDFPLAAQQENRAQQVKLTRPTRLDWTFVMAPRNVPTPPEQWLADYDFNEHSYQLYVPESCVPDKPCGLLLFISPMDQPMSMADWQQVCDDAGLILVMGNRAGNEVHPPTRLRIILDSFDDVRRKYTIDADRTYISGFSGGGRLACRIAFALPEYFGGVIPIGSSGEMRNESWLRHRVINRISVAQLIGNEDYNLVELREFRGPLFDAAGVRHKLWIVPGLKHQIPGAEVLAEAIQWLDQAIDQRSAYAKQYPASRVEPNEAPDRWQQSEALYEEAEQRRRQGETRFTGDMVLKGIVSRWPELELSKEIAATLNAEMSWREQEMNEMHEYLRHRSRGLDAYATKETHPFYADQKRVRLEAAILSWSTIVKGATNDDAVREATERLIELEMMLDQLPEKESDPGGDGKQDQVPTGGNRGDGRF